MRDNYISHNDGIYVNPACQSGSYRNNQDDVNARRKYRMQENIAGDIKRHKGQKEGKEAREPEETDKIKRKIDRLKFIKERHRKVILEPRRKLSREGSFEDDEDFYN